MIHIKEVVTFRLNDYLMSLESDQDHDKIKTYDGKTARVSRINKVSQIKTYYDIRFPDGFVIKQIEEKHCPPIRARRYKGKNR